MKKNIFAITAAAALVLNIAATSVTTFAATNQSTDAKASLTDTDDKGNKNEITLDSAPEINFGSQQITATGNKFTQADTITSNIQVTNPGVDSGWNVTLAASDFTSATGATLKGATFKLDAGAASINNTNSAAATPAAYTNVTGSNASTVVFSAADSTQGVGINYDTNDKSTASLDIPAGNVAGDYTANLTWTLADTPATSTN
jgi:hypothetical protein